MDRIIIGIAGGTGSGKTSVANLIVEDLEKFGSSVALLEQDSYYKDHLELTYEQRRKLNYDHPDAIDFELLIKHIKALKNGEDIDKPKYDFTKHKRMEEKEHITSKPIIIVEGILILTLAKIRDLFDVKIFVDTDADERLMRRIIRDMEFRGRTIESILTQYKETVKPMHEEFVEPSKKYADIIIPRGGENVAAMSILKGHLNIMLNK